MPVADWRLHFEGRGNYRAECRLCGHALDVRGNRPRKHLSEKHPDAGGPVARPEPPTSAAPRNEAPAPPPAIPGVLSGKRDREALLKGLWEDAENEELSASERARSRELIAKVEGYADDREATPDEVRDRHVRRVEASIERQDGAAKEVLALLQHPIHGKAAIEWMKGLIAKAEGVER